MADAKAAEDSLELQGVIGFNGGVKCGLLLHPGDQHIIYPLGSTIVVKHLTENTQTFLQRDGHDRAVSCLALSSTGKYLASGQETYMGFVADVIIWNLETYEIHHKLKLHKGKIQDLAFSPNEEFLVTLGGRDDNKIAVWNVATGQPICGDSAANQTALTVRFFNHNNFMLVSAGNYNMRKWEFDLPNRKLRYHEVEMGQMRRITNSLTIDDNDEFMYCGTDTGDVLQVKLGPNLFNKSGPGKKKNLSQGIQVSAKTHDGQGLIVGAGDGTVALLNCSKLKGVVRKVQFDGGITSIAFNAAGDHFFVGTKTCNIYLVHLDTFEYELRSTCHSTKINDVGFPRGYSELFATCAMENIRVWHARTRNELLRIRVPNLECLCVCFAPDGKAILSGWSDGKIRAFKPQTGKLMYAIHDAHRDGVTALSCTSDCRRVISGGQTGQVRVWSIGRNSQKMIASMKEHKGRVNSVHINADDLECVSASNDGSCIVWCLQRFVRQHCLFASTQFKAIVYHPDQSQLLTTGSDRKLTYWDVVDGNPIRIIDGSEENTVNCLAITEDGDKFVSAGGDKLVQVWGYDEGYRYYNGYGHSGEIVQCAISPDQNTIVSVGDEGAIFLWGMPDVQFNQPPEM